MLLLLLLALLLACRPVTLPLPLKGRFPVLELCWSLMEVFMATDMGFRWLAPLVALLLVLLIMLFDLLLVVVVLDDRVVGPLLPPLLLALAAGFHRVPMAMRSSGSLPEKGSFKR